MTPTQRSFAVTAELSSTTSVQETSKLFEGLCRLEQVGKIDFAIAPCARPSHPRVICLAVRNRDGEQRRVAIDLDDSTEPCSMDDLNRADQYFKRSYHPAQSALLLPAEFAGKLRAFGLNNPAIGGGARWRMLTAGWRAGRPARQLWVDLRQLLALPTPEAFECLPSAPVEPLIMFQTRLWPERDDDPGIAVLNLERAELVRALQRAFGARFLGGLVPSPLATVRYPDLITTLPYRMRAYPRLVKRALIGVYTRGLRDSVGFKMSEYLAAGRCIVAHPIDTELPQPLLEGSNHLTFRSTDECVARCESLLVDPAKAQEMRAANWLYYQSNVEPGAHLLKTLERAFAQS